ncbi:uncharacterized protein TM35_000251450 [Trypanosoma theileri]|uniref:RING-type domain-containing protein n=1 Tax=Trypanosoma theileri TaxID=67003 RepID=A0A1X0NRP0_9TRYP|nr:uncharacterized protein TM35_000251450 [Trypanosoma theileri]ORC86849.1 hypothetical protein TM35_000251450 [Trypanosoma theileri]
MITPDPNQHNNGDAIYILHVKENNIPVSQPPVVYMQKRVVRVAPMNTAGNCLTPTRETQQQYQYQYHHHHMNNYNNTPPKLLPSPSHTYQQQRSPQIQRSPQNQQQLYTQHMNGRASTPQRSGVGVYPPPLLSPLPPPTTAYQYHDDNDKDKHKHCQLLPALKRKLTSTKSSNKNKDKDKNKKGIRKEGSSPLGLNGRCCMCRKKQSVFLLEPCHHLCLCEECAPQLKGRNCPCCHYMFTRITRVYGT